MSVLNGLVKAADQLQGRELYPGVRVNDRFPSRWAQVIQDGPQLIASKSRTFGVVPWQTPWVKDAKSGKEADVGETTFNILDEGIEEALPYTIHGLPHRPGGLYLFSLKIRLAVVLRNVGQEFLEFWAAFISNLHGSQRIDR
ncbi:hypothetical protein F7725_028453 [Dissostichus mawsoni]|uniref:Uncharacterized protein n=1 Tax=Dissostichus mawsoni TaxID=36200 RepID=A0A7J5XFP5_DISMA|nr:hypothetical protein F7725_028453 [Dissostichus mawsoni]